MRVLELFSGTGSVTKYCKQRGWECVSVDWDPKSGADHCCDIMNFEPEGTFDIVWASPDCRIYSVLQHVHLGRKWENAAELNAERRKHDKYALRVLELIARLQPKAWFIENPAFSNMWDIAQLKALPYIMVAYCQFSSPEEQFHYRKNTRIASNIVLPDRPCTCTHKHKERVWSIHCKKSHRVPQKLLNYLFTEVMHNNCGLERTQ